MTDDDRRAAYIREIGREPPVDDTDEAWQWAYRGCEAERELLLDMIQTEAEAQQLSLC